MSNDEHCRKSRIIRTSNESWSLRTSFGHDESCCFLTTLLLGPPSSSPGSAIDEKESQDLPDTLNEDRIMERNISVVSTLISTSRLPRLRALVSSISTSPPPIRGMAPHTIKLTQNRGLGMFARKDIQKGLERNEETSQEVFQLLVDGFLEGFEGAVKLGSTEEIREIREAGKERYEEVRKMAISCSFNGGHWLEGVVRTNALVLEFEGGQKRCKEEKREIYGGVYPLINRCNHSCVPNAVVQFLPSFLTSCLYALRDIKVGEEITKSYVNPLLRRETRMKTLRENYGFECDCRSCTSSIADSASSDERRSQLADILSTPTFTRWASDLARADDFLAEKHHWALNVVEEEQVWGVEGVFLEEMALSCALMGDGEGFRNWARKVVDARRWLGQLGEIPEGEERESWRKWVWWLEDPERRVKKWGRRRKMKEEMSRRKSGVDLEVGMLEEFFDK